LKTSFMNVNGLRRNPELAGEGILGRVHGQAN
jgi:hypothetical protein